MVHRPAIEENVKKPAAYQAQQGRSGDPTPKVIERGARRIRPPFGIAIDQHGGVHRPCRGARNAVDVQPRFFEQAIESTPGKGAVRAAAQSIAQVR
jgi:hypothetical protein